MPTPRTRWYHVTWNTLSSWLPGDERGFRNRHHRIHSSGDYKHRPPKSEHAGLRIYNEKRAAPPVFIAPTVRARIFEAILEFMNRRGIQILCISVSDQHVHILVKLDVSRAEVMTFIGKCKNIVSTQVRDAMPGSIWSRGCNPKPIRDRSHQLNVFNYITKKQENGAWIWDFQRGGRVMKK